MSSREATDPASLPWRKRHPVFSRMVLYVLGLGLVALLVVLWNERKATDEQDRQDALAAELDALATLHVLDEDGTLVLKALDERFSGRDLPIKTQARALRWRALAHRKRKEPALMNEALAKASELELEPLERHALNLEWAEGRLAFGDREGALDVLPADADVQSPLPLSLLRTLLFAQAERIGGQANRAAERLSTTLIKLPQPLDPAVSVFVGGRDWTAAQVATVMSEWVAEAGPEAPLNVWRRLALLGPQDAQAQIVAARGLLLTGDEEAAKAAWRRAEALDPKETKAVAARDPRLKPLQTPRRP